MMAHHPPLLRIVGATTAAIALHLDAATRTVRVSAAPKPLTRHTARHKPAGETVPALLARIGATPTQPRATPAADEPPATSRLLIPGLRPPIAATA